MEQSYQGQLYGLLRMFLDVPPGMRNYARSGANPFQPGEIVARLREIAIGIQQERSQSAAPSEE